ncbi:MAG: PrsW family intramembrane metalloprotease [Spirochaetales bacterium]|nr:MAG: PrsW family intramembrane metalloprotease [Spirochaetales bacterium]
MSEIMTLVAGSALPIIVIIAWFYRLDRARPEPVGLIGRSVLFGFLAAVPAILLEFVVDLPTAVLPFPFSIVWTAFITAALVEEGVKYFFLKRYLVTNRHFDEVMDGILYAVCVSLGFAFAENILYGLADRGALLLRAFTAVPMHAAATGIMGYWMGLAKRESHPARAAAMYRKGFMTAVLIHGLYDLFLFTASFLALGAVVILLIAIAKVLGLARQARLIDDMDSGSGTRD